jgi:hypothetical protein
MALTSRLCPCRLRAGGCCFSCLDAFGWCNRCAGSCVLAMDLGSMHRRPAADGEGFAAIVSERTLRRWFIERTQVILHRRPSPCSNPAGEQLTSGDRAGARRCAYIACQACVACQVVRMLVWFVVCPPRVAHQLRGPALRGSVRRANARSIAATTAALRERAARTRCPRPPAVAPAPVPS